MLHQGKLPKGYSKHHEGHHGWNGTKSASSPTYHSWRNMIRRCYQKSCVDFHLYGGRGIRVCVKWIDFENFLSDMGIRPESKTLDRINTNLHYTPDNCKWSTLSEQCSSRRKGSLKKKLPCGIFLARSGRYIARIVDPRTQLNGRSSRINLGTFNSIEEAVAIYDKQYYIIWGKNMDRTV